jgi:4,5-dihydroxyphthalate decarboxylase
LEGADLHRIVQVWQTCREEASTMTATENITLERTTLRAAFDEYPHTLPLHRGEIKSNTVALALSDIRPANKFFKPMVREQKFDVSEIAIGTFLQAKAYGKPLVLLPATMMGRFQHGTILCRASHPFTPAELTGKRVGVRAYAQTTGNWVRGILQNEYGVKPDQMHWVVFEDGHVAEYRDPPTVERAAAGKNILQMLRDGELDAAIYGADLPNDPNLKSVIPDPDTAARKWYEQHGVVPINHMVCVTESLAQSKPQAVVEVYRMLAASKAAAGLTKAAGIDFLPYGFEACRPALETMIKYCTQQNLLPRALEVDELFDNTTRALQP